MDEMVTIRPRVSCATMLRAAAWHDRNTPRRFVSMTASHADTTMFRTEAFGTMPAFAIVITQDDAGARVMKRPSDAQTDARRHARHYHDLPIEPRDRFLAPCRLVCHKA